MKPANIDIHGVYTLFNTGGIEVHIEEGYDPFVFWRMSCGEKCGEYDACYNCNGCKWHKAKINYTQKGAFFRAGGMRVYLDQVMRI